MRGGVIGPRRGDRVCEALLAGWVWGRGQVVHVQTRYVDGPTPRSVRVDGTVCPVDERNGLPGVTGPDRAMRP